MTEHKFVKVGQVADVPPGTMLMVKLDRAQVLLANVAGRFYAINNMCSHKMGRLAKDRLDDVEVVCPFHQARFSVITREALTAPATKSVKTYEVRLTGEDILIRSINI